MTDHQRFIYLIFQHTEVQFHTDNEHEKDQSDLTQQFKIGQRMDREQEMKSIPGKKAPKQKPQEQYRLRFLHHSRLPDKN